MRSLALIVGLPLVALARVGSPEEPVRILRSEIDLSAHDGGLPPAIGTENIQVMRANRMHPGSADGFGWTYTHAPMLAHWNGRFYLQYLSNPFGEHVPPGQTLVANSLDGRNWEMPHQVFPIYWVRPGSIATPESGMAVMHQRMGFYVAPNQRLLVVGFYGRAPIPVGKTGIGRVVREAYKDGTYGPIYFIRYNAGGGVDESNTRYPFYQRSPDAGFVEACDALLADKLKTMQWRDEDHSDDGFYTTPGPVLESPSVYRRKDGVAVSLWKWGWTGLSSDEGNSWSLPVKVSSIVTAGAKTWGQRTEDDRFAIAYIPVNDGSHRWPLAMVTSDDGITFDHMVAIHGEVPPRRYFGRAKDFGPQYVRGISEGNGEPPGDDLWLTYSLNKEDIWISRVPLPVKYEATGPVRDDFDQLETDAPIPAWNLYRPKWATTAVAAFPNATDKSLKFEDRDPVDYAKAVRVFPRAEFTQISFKIYAGQADSGRFEIEVLDRGGRRPVRLVFNDQGKIEAVNGAQTVELGSYAGKTWIDVVLSVDAARRTYTLALGANEILTSATFAEPVASVERLSFRTGGYRTEPTRKTDRYSGEDLNGTDTPVVPAVYFVDELKIEAPDSRP